jgi:dsRNA-specific ribonuclease
VSSLIWRRIKGLSKRFEVKVVCGSKEYGRGIGRSKKEAEQNAAKQGLVKLGEY